jgi:hypothetical protein
VSHSGKRDLDAEYGYDDTPSFQDFRNKYRRIGYANRIVAGVAKSCWRDGAELLSEPPEDGVDDNVVLQDEMSVLKQRGMFKALEKADTLNRLGEFSVMYIGMPGDPKEPAGSESGDLEDVYFAQYDQDSVQMHSFNTDPESERHGKPELYTLTTRVKQTTGNTTTTQKQTIVAHWTRVVHMAEGSLTDDLIGQSVLQPINDALQDYNKVRGGTAEAYFRNAGRAFFMLLEDKANLSGEDRDALNEMAEQFINKMRNFLYVKGAKSVSDISTNIPDPKEVIKTLLQEMSAMSGIPIRILTGEGAGQLAGNEDKASYNTLVDDRQSSECEGYLRDTLSSLAMGKLMPDTRELYVKWPLQKATDAKTDAEVDKISAETEKIQAETELIEEQTALTRERPAEQEENPEDDLTDLE